jgi:large subunit ribosomal protein L25
MMALKHLGANALLELDVEGSTQLALTKQVQIDPIRRTLEHIDFVAVRRGEKVTVDIPVHVTGEAAADALVVTETSTVSVEAEATHIPDYVEVSVEGAAVGHQVLAKDLQLPGGATVLLDGDTLVVNVTHAPTAEEVESDLAGAEAEAGIERDESEADAGDADSAEGGSGASEDTAAE